MSSTARIRDKSEKVPRTKGSSKSQLPQIRSQASSVQQRNTFADRVQQKDKQSNVDNSNAGGDLTGCESKVSRNKTPTQRKPSVPNRGLPSIMSSGTQRSKDLYSRNYVLDIDNQLYSARQNGYHVNNFYKKVINQRVLGPEQHTPLLVHETSLLTQMAQTSRPGTKDNFSIKHRANLSKTIQDDLVTVERMINDPSALENSFIQVRQDKRTMLPTLAHLQSDDSLFGGESKTIAAESALLKDVKKPGHLQFSTITDNIMNTTDMTQPHTSKHTADNYMQMTIQESVLRHSHIFDPLAGNSVISHLNTSVRLDAKNRISQNIQRGHRQRSQQRRRREIAGESELKNKPGNFVHKGVLEEVSSDSQVTQTESLANSSIYKELVQDLEGINKNFEKEKIQANLRSPESPRSPNAAFLAMVASQTTYGDTQKDITEEDETKLMLEDPEAHFRKLKAKIKFKVIKKYQEDKEKKAKEDAKAKDPVVMVKDKFGRQMPQVPTNRLTTNKMPSMSRIPVKKAAPKRKLSFTESQLKYYGANDIYNPINQQGRPTLTDKYIIEFMDQVNRFPIPEALVNRTPNEPYRLTIDSIIKKFYTFEAAEEMANQKPANAAPYNSLESDEEFTLAESVSSEDPNSVPYITTAKLREDPTLKEKNFDVRILDNSPFRLESVKYYPFRSREGEIPLKLLKVRKLSYLLDSAPKILQQLEEEPWSAELVQNVFEHYCMEMKAAPISLSKFYNYEDPKHTRLSFRNYQLDDVTAKALALVLPYIHDINEVDFGNNQMTDLVSASVVMAIFANPKINRMTMAYNYMRSTFTRVLAKLIAANPSKLTDLNLMGSIIFNDHIDPLIRELPKMPYLTNLNIAGCALSGASCRNLSLFMIKCFTLRMMDVSHCRISFQGTRYLIDALNRNTCIRNFNFSYNDLNSSSYEFSIKVASIITRHPCLMHLDITNTGLKREEIMFIGFAIPLSKTLLSIHLTAQRLPYYERIFLRAIIAAKVGFRQRSTGGKKEIRSHKDKNQVLQMASGEVQDNQLQLYTESLRDLDDKRQGMDVEIQDLLLEIDTEAIFEKLDPETGALADLPENSKIGQLVRKLVERQKEVEDQQKNIEKIYAEEKVNIGKRIDALDGLSDFGKEAFEAFGNPDQQKNVRKPEAQEDLFKKMRELRVERHQQRAEIEIMKENKDRSAGELALMFMGINQVAYAQLVENPMVGYMNEIVFSRVLGNDDIEEGHFWVDTTQCWICNRWNKVIVAYNPHHDKEIFTQKVFQVEKLKQTVNNFVQDGIDKERLAKMREEVEVVKDPIKVSSNGRIEEVDAEFEQTMRPSAITFNQTAKADYSFNRDESPSKMKRMMTMGATGDQFQSNDYTGLVPQTASKDQSDVVDEAGFLHSEKTISDNNSTLTTKRLIDLEVAKNSTDAMAPIRTTFEHVRNFVFPENFQQLDQKKEISYPMPSAQKMYSDELQQLDHLEKKFEEIGERYYGVSPMSSKNKVKVTPVGDHETNSDLNETAQAIQRNYVGKKGNYSFEKQNTLGAQTSVISHHETRRQHGAPVIIQRQIFFQGVVYQIQEELYSDPDHSSVYSSDDDFEVDDHIQKKFKLVNPQVSDLTSLENQSYAEKMFTKKGGTTDSLSPLQSGNVTPRTPNNLQKTPDATPPRTPNKKKTQIKDGKEDKKTDVKDASLTTKNSVLAKISKKETATAPPPSKKKNQTYSKERQALMREYYTNTPGLTKEQREYESKLMPKFYIPELAEKRMKVFEENFSEQFNKSVVPQRRESAIKSHLSADRKQSELFQPKDKEIFCIASFNDWMPARMKTLRRLNVERFSMSTPEEEIPKSYKLMDNVTALCSAMVPPGEHYFYFVRNEGRVFLSPQYEVVRFKSTNIFLNRVIIGKRWEDMETVHMAKLGDEEEEIFMKDRSVFKDFKEDTQKHLKNCFDDDMWYGKIIRTIKKGSDQQHEFNEIKDFLLDHYVRIINIFTYYSGASSAYPTIGFNDFTSFAKRCKVVLAEDGLTDLDLLVVATAVSHHQWVNSATLDLTRYEFFEIIVRIANFYFKDRGLVKTTCQGIEKVLNEMIYPNAKSMDGDNFRRYQCYNVKTNEILKKNEAMLFKIYNSFTHAKKKWIQNDECVVLVRKIGLDVSEIMIGACYAESMITIQDPIKDQMRPKMMKYVEFLVFLCRVVHEHYNGTDKAKELLYLKLDHLMPQILGYLNLQPLFLFNEKFKSEELEEKQKHERKKRQLKKAMRKSKQTGKPVDPKLLAEVMKYEENLQKTGKGNFKAAQLGSTMFMDDSDESQGDHSSDEEKFDRENPTPAIPEDEAEDFDERDEPKNLDLATDIGTSDGPIGVVIPPPDRKPPLVEVRQEDSDHEPAV